MAQEASSRLVDVTRYIDDIGRKSFVDSFENTSAFTSMIREVIGAKKSKGEMQD